MKLDTHVHTFHSGDSTIYPLHILLRESYNTPEGVYRQAKARGRSLVAITDHDEISGALANVHLNVFGLTLPQHQEIQRLRHDIRELLPFLKQQKLFTSLNHVASGINGPITAPHVAVLLPWVNALEVNNGSRLPIQNRTAQCLAEASGKIGIAGSDSHTHRGIGRTWTKSPVRALATSSSPGWSRVR